MVPALSASSALLARLELLALPAALLCTWEERRRDLMQPSPAAPDCPWLLSLPKPDWLLEDCLWMRGGPKGPRSSGEGRGATRRRGTLCWRISGPAWIQRAAPPPPGLAGADPTSTEAARIHPKPPEVARGPAKLPEAVRSLPYPFGISQGHPRPSRGPPEVAWRPR